MPAQFDGREGGQITLAAGAALTSTFRTNFSSQPKGRFFGREILESILAQTDCVGIRFYFGQNSNNQFELVICGADAAGDDMLDLIADISVPCPSYCSSSNDLNS